MRLLSSTAMYDYNFPVFHNILNPAQREAINRTVGAIVNTAIAPLVIACILSTVSGFILWRDSERVRVQWRMERRK